MTVPPVVMSIPGQAASWDDQIVPTLKKRLETESQYLSNRLSSSVILDYPGSSSLASPSSQAGSHPLQSNLSQSAPDNVRTRTKSSPYFDLPAEAGPSRIPVPSSSYRPSPSSSRRPSYGDNLEESRIPRLQPPLRRPSGTTPPLPDIGGRTLTRPRFKTTLASRPDMQRSGSGSSSDRQYPPSGIPIPSHRNRQRSTSISPVKGDPSGSRNMAEKRDNDVREVLSHRESFDLSAQVYPDTLLRDELPPFRLAPEEAMQIARHGYDLDNKQDARDEGGIGDEDDTGSKRKSTESMFPAKQPGTQARKYDAKKETIPRSGTGSSLGLGRAPSTSRSGFTSKTTPLRSATTSNPLRSGSGLSSSQTSTSRSVSVGLGPTPPRMGVAAHFVPPESSYTPPKGTNWDDVVLPVIAKKMGLTGSAEKRVGAEEMEEGDLAVEWDKNGTPVKWVKRNNMGASSRLGQQEGIVAGGDLEDAYDYNEVAIPSSRSAFSPTFEPSPDNPLHHPRPIRPDPTTSVDTTPTPTPKPQKNYEPQIRTTNAFDTSYSTDTAPPSPAPFSNFPRRPSTGPLALRPENIDIPNQRLQEGEVGRISRKPSFLSKKSGQVVSRQQSGVSLRTSSRDDASRLGQGTSIGQGQIPRHQQTGIGPGPTGMQAAGMSNRAPQEGGAERSGQRPGARDSAGKDTHGKGCGCVIM